MSTTAGSVSFETYSGSPPENYQQYFVPAIGEPLARTLVAAARLRGGERVLDVACGTGVVARLAAERVGSSGSVAGVDVNPGMLAIAEATTPPDRAITWHEADAERLPQADAAVDVVLCQMGLQFVPDRAAAVREMRRVLAPGGRLALNAPGPTPPVMAVLADALATHIGPDLAGFVHAVFSLHDPDELDGLLAAAGFDERAVTTSTERLHLPAPAEFLWQYVRSTPLAEPVGQVDDSVRAAIQRDVLAGWQPVVDDGGLAVDVDLVTATAA